MVSATRRLRPGKTNFGCLFMLVFIGAVGYFGYNIGVHFWRNYQYEDRMAQEARFAAKRSDQTIQRRLGLFADSLGLPESAQKVKVRRRGGTIQIWTEYYVMVEFPGFVREMHFAPQTVATY